MSQEIHRTTKGFFNKVNSDKYFSILLGLISGFAVFYILYFFEAYGIQKGLSYSGHTHLFRSVSFGILTGVYLMFFESILKPKLNINKIKQLILWYLFLIFLGVNLIFLLFNYFWNWQEWNVEAYVLILKEFPLIMLLPLTFYLILKKIPKQKEVQDALLVFQSSNGKDQLQIPLQDFLFANSSENYITIYYTRYDASRQHLIRKPLKVLEQELKNHTSIMRSHRSFLVNKINIQSVQQVKGKVFIEMQQKNIPVSKAYQDKFLN
ncbi:LytTR family transcriptional regulator DNA-binding domain-containing protein [Lutimonas sp.]|uniref:LytTR family transcriptional regulator DNA-binding domain-containing protein n=1 Tax=Lutimonas sp. TaxID=1872403 RepID=UPI003D9BE826